MVTFGPHAIAGHAAGGLVRHAAAGAVLNAAQIDRQEAAVEVVSSGFPGLDALLPAGGIRRGSLYCLATNCLVTDCLVTDCFTADAPMQGRAGSAGAAGLAGSGALTLACAIACRLAAAANVAGKIVAGTIAAGTIVVVDRGTSSSWGGGFHPPAVMPWLAMPWGPQHRDRRAHRGSDEPPPLIIARPSCDDDEIWTIDQALRCPGVAAVVAWPSALRSRSAGAWSVAMRRWQLAARSSGAVALFVRPAAARREPSWAEAHIAVSPGLAVSPGMDGHGGLLERRLRLELVGGSWAARVSSGDSPVNRAVEIVFDLAHGCERASRDMARRDAACRDRPRADMARSAAAAGGGARVSTAAGGCREEKRRVAR